MTKQTSTHAAAAKMIRAELKKNGIKASVRSESYSGGSSITVRVEADICPATRDAIEAFTSRFEYGHFNSMEDIYEYSSRNDDLPQVKFVFVEVEYSDAIQQRAWDFTRNYWAGLEDAPESLEDARDYYCETLNCWAQEAVYRALRGRDAGFWQNEKPRVRAA